MKNILRFANRRKHFKKMNNAAGFDVPGRVTVLPVCYAGRLFIFCFVGIAQTLEGFPADDMLRRCRVYSSLDQPVVKKRYFS